MRHKFQHAVIMEMCDHLLFHRMDERFAEQKSLQDEKEKQEKERLMEATLLKATNQLHQENYSKRIHEMTYNTDHSSHTQRRFAFV